MPRPGGRVHIARSTELPEPPRSPSTAHSTPPSHNHHTSPAPAPAPPVVIAPVDGATPPPAEAALALPRPPSTAAVAKEAALLPPAPLPLLPPPPPHHHPPPQPTPAPRIASSFDQTSPEIQAAIAHAAASPDVIRAVATLQAPMSTNAVRGCQVNPGRPELEAIRRQIGWTLGGYDTRPPAHVRDQKQKDSISVLLKYRQPPAGGAAGGLRVCMYDYIMHTIFNLHVKDIDATVIVPAFQQMDGSTIIPSWKEVDWTLHDSTGGRGQTPSPAFVQNKYAYQLEPLKGLPVDAVEMQRVVHHYVLWYFHRAGEPLPRPSDASIEKEVRIAVTTAAHSAGFKNADYIWYHNPGFSVPDVYHVQVFWRISADAAELVLG